MRRGGDRGWGLGAGPGGSVRSGARLPPRPPRVVPSQVRVREQEPVLPQGVRPAALDRQPAAQLREARRRRGPAGRAGAAGMCRGGGSLPWGAELGVEELLCPSVLSGLGSAPLHVLAHRVRSFPFSIPPPALLCWGSAGSGVSRASRPTWCEKIAIFFRQDLLLLSMIAGVGVLPTRSAL